MFSLHIWSVSFLFVIHCGIAVAGDPWHPASAPEAGMNNTCIMRDAFWSSFHNQAALAYQKSFSAGISYGNRFGIKELATRSAAVIYPAGNASVGAVYSCFGFPDFRRHHAGLACGLKLSDKLAAGSQVDFLSERTSGEYRDHNMLAFGFGLMFSPGENVTAGIHVFNPVPHSGDLFFGHSAIRAGVGKLLAENLFGGVEVEMRTGSTMVFRAGLEYEAMEKIQLRTGFCTENTSFSFGVGYRMSFMQLDLGFVTHERLGVSSNVSLVFEINYKN